MKKALTNLFIFVVLFIFIVDSTPWTCRFHGRLKQNIDWIIDVTGLWQSTWQLFAPDVDKVNTRVSAEVDYSNGETKRWKSQDWSQVSNWGKFVRFREMEFYDSIRTNANDEAWESFAHYMVRTLRPEGGAFIKPLEVRLTRHWVDIELPDPETGPKPTKWKAYQFYSKSFRKTEEVQ